MILFYKKHNLKEECNHRNKILSKTDFEKSGSSMTIYKKHNLKEECIHRDEILSKTNLEKSSLTKTIYKDTF